MVDTVRTLAALQTLLADNTSGAISPQDLRDMLVSVYPQVVYKDTTEGVTSSTVLQDDNELFLVVEASKTYVIFGVLFHDGANTADLKVFFAVPAGATVIQGVLGPATNATTFDAAQVTNQSLIATAMPVGTLGAGNRALAFVVASVTTGVTPGNVVLQWAQNTSNATATQIFAGSFLIGFGPQ